MKAATHSTTGTTTDDILVQASREGDRQAFADLVERYRRLVVGVAYNQLGDFGRSEDIAQQTFVTAWMRNFDLADPTRIAAWFCGIARNLVRNEYRRLAKMPADSISDHQVAVTTLSPEQLTIHREEEDLLWSILEKIPETLREPMILYYRQDATTAEVASALQISEEVVRQRLSRGRKLLEQKVAEFVENTLKKRDTAHDFVASVLVAIPTAAVAHSSGVMSVLGAVTAKLLPGVGAFVGPMIGIAGGIYGSKRSLDSATSDVERRVLWRMIIVLTLLVVAFVTIQLILAVGFPDWKWRLLIQGTLWAVYAVLLTTMIVLGNRRIETIKREYGTISERQMQHAARATVSPTAAAWNLVVAITGCVAWMIIVAILRQDWIGLLLTTVLLSGIFTAFVPRVHKATTANQLLRINSLAVLATIAGTAVLVAYRWSVWDLAEWINSAY